jgi:hypothetical protein
MSGHCSRRQTFSWPGQAVGWCRDIAGEGRPEQGGGFSVWPVYVLFKKEALQKEASREAKKISIILSSPC